MRIKHLSLLCSALLLSQTSFAADKPSWNVSADHGKTKTISFTTDEGTWLDLDVSPDGNSIVFSMMGDIYLMPISGGNAQRISSGPAWDVQPRFSPNGKEIAFTSDRAGGNNLWRMNRDGSASKQVTKESFRLFNNPIWTPDSQFLIGRKHFTSERSLGAGELWMTHRDGGEGLQLTKRKNDQMDLGEPAISPDGRYVYYSEDVSEGDYFEYNKNVYEVIYAIKRLDRDTGETQTLINTPGGAIRPQPSPDGKKLAFVKRVRDKSVLHVLDLQSGKVTPVWDGLSHDMQEAWAIFGPYANFNWTPDSQSVVIWAQGKIWRVNMQTGTPQNIAFNAEVSQKLTAPIRFTNSLEGASFNAKMLRDVATSPDDKTVIFHAVGHLWKRVGNSNPTRLTQDNTHFEYQPSFSADGKKILYTTWSDATQSSIRELDLSTGASRILNTEPGFYYQPRFSPNGQHVVFVKAGGSSLTGSLNSLNRGIFTTPINTWAPTKIATGAEPQFSPDSKRVFYMSGSDLAKKVMRVGIHGENPREVFNLKYVDSVQFSPDGKHIAFTELYNAYVAPLPAFGGSIELSKDTTAIPVRALTKSAGPYLHWSNANTVHWMLGNEYHTRNITSSQNTAPSKISLSVASDAPNDTVAFTGARIITMKNAESAQEVIENGTVLVQGTKILAVGSAVNVPANARMIDAKGKTIFPGIIDAHAHASHFNSGVVPQQNWAYYANLAFGITTIHDPSATSETVFSQAELQKAGQLVGPRILSTGTILYGADGDFKAVINSLEDAQNTMTRMKAVGALSVKSYNQPRRDQRQQINQAAREQGLLVVEEGGSTFNHNMTMMLDGVTGIEHNIPIAPLYKDVVDTWKQTDVRNTPTLVVNYGGVNGEYYWYNKMNIWENERFLKFYPQGALDARAIRREVGPDWDYYHVEVAKQAKRLRDAGIKIQIGGHGQMQGLSPNWEIWSLVQGGFSPWQALRAATIDGADYLGYAAELGSIEAGKRADLVITNTNPLDNIQNTIDTAYVMVNGRLFDAASMAEIGGKNRPAPEFYFSQQQAGLSVGQEFGPTMEAQGD
ncbi:MAG: PD40 domain-containing protein [Arenimonas sp.]|nr:PD40 domain-containing protein [Arenimonas sp.]